MQFVGHGLLEQGLPVKAQPHGAGEVPPNLLRIDGRTGKRLGQVGADGHFVPASPRVVVLFFLLDVLSLEDVFDGWFDELLKADQGVADAPRAISFAGAFLRSIRPRIAAATVTTAATIPAKNRTFSSMGHLRRRNGRSHGPFSPDGDRVCQALRRWLARRVSLTSWPRTAQSTVNNITRAAWTTRARSSGVIEPRATMPSSVASVLLMRKSCGAPILSFSLFLTSRAQDVADGHGLGKRIIRVLLPARNGRRSRPPWRRPDGSSG